MAEIYPAGTTTIRNLQETFIYFLVVKPDSLADDIPQKEYFCYRFIVPVTSKAGIKALKTYFSGITLDECRALEDTEYSSGTFSHPMYTNSRNLALQFPLKDIPIYIQQNIRTIDLEKDKYQMGSKPIIRENTSAILPDTYSQRRGGNIL